MTPPTLWTAQSPFFIYAYFGVHVKVHNVCPALLSLQLFCLHLPTASSTSLSISFFLIRPCLSLDVLITAYFHYADEGGPEEHHTLGRRACMLLLCTTLFGTLAALHTCQPPWHTLSHCSLSHFFLERTHAWWDHTPGPGAGVYYVWVGLSSRCLVSRLGKPQNHTEAQHLSVADRGLAQLGGAGRSTARQKPGSGLVHVLGGLPGWCASSHNLAVLQTSLLWRSAVPSVKQSREG